MTGYKLYLLYLALSSVLLYVVAFAYKWITPINEYKLIKEGNTAVATAMVGTLIGLALPLASVIIHSLSIPDMLYWAVGALVYQLGVWFLVNATFGFTLRTQLEAGSMSHGIILAGANVAFGILNAACVVG